MSLLLTLLNQYICARLSLIYIYLLNLNRVQVFSKQRVLTEYECTMSNDYLKTSRMILSDIIYRCAFGICIEKEMLT